MKKLVSLFISVIMLHVYVFGEPPDIRKNVQRPKLVISIVVDQMRADYLDRFDDLFCDGGFRLFMKNGVRFTSCNYEYTPTNTGPGHSFVLSGIYPGTSGIISNDWYSGAAGRLIYCVEDSTVSSLGIGENDPAGKMSPRNFHGESVGDQLKKSSPQSKVIGIALKDRGAILPTGQHANGAYWFDPQSGYWISSSYYFHQLPAWVAAFNERHLPESYFDKQWVKLLPDSAYARQGSDDAKGEGTIPGDNTDFFPHSIRDLDRHREVFGATNRRFDAILPTPSGDDLTVQFAEAAMKGERLGQNDATDILSISFSSLDYCGHIFGPDSYEIEDMIVRLDRRLEDFFSFVDSTVGLKNTVIVLTADHGVCPLPEKSAPGIAGRINARDILMDIKVRIGQKFHYDEGTINLIQTISNDFVYLNDAAIKARGLSIDSFEVAVGDACLKEPHIAKYFTRAQIEHSIAGGGSDDLILRHIAKGFNRELSGNVALVPAAYSFFSGGSRGTTHGTAYEYDTHVPLLFYGTGIQKGVYSDPVSPSLISGTLCRILDIPLPENSLGTVFAKMLEPVK